MNILDLYIYCTIFFINLWSWRSIDLHHIIIEEGGDESWCHNFIDPGIFWIIIAVVSSLLTSLFGRLFVLCLGKCCININWFCHIATLITCSILSFLAYTIIHVDEREGEVLCNPPTLFPVPFIGWIGYLILEWFIITFIWTFCGYFVTKENPVYLPRENYCCYKLIFCKCCKNNKNNNSDDVELGIHIDNNKPKESVVKSGLSGAVKGAASAAIKGENVMTGAVSGAVGSTVATTVKNKTQNNITTNVAGNIAEHAASAMI